MNIIYIVESENEEKLFRAFTCKQCNIDVFKKNHKLLLKKTKKVYLLIQNKNLEQELSKALNKNCIELYKIFKCTKEKDFKSRFNKATQLIQTIENHNINYKLLWCRYEDFKNILGNS